MSANSLKTKYTILPKVTRHLIESPPLVTPRIGQTDAPVLLEGTLENPFTDLSGQPVIRKIKSKLLKGQPVLPEGTLENPFEKLAGQPLIRKYESKSPEGIASEQPVLSEGTLETPFEKLAGQPLIRKYEWTPPERVTSAQTVLPEGTLKSPDGQPLIRRKLSKQPEFAFSHSKLLALEPQLTKLPTQRLEPESRKLLAQRPYMSIFFFFEPLFKDRMDVLRQTYMSRYLPLDQIKPSLGPEYPIFQLIEMDRRGECEDLVRELCARISPFDVKLLPWYGQAHKRKERLWHVGLEMASPGDLHSQIAREIYSRLWPTKPNGAGRTPRIILYTNAKTDQEAKYVWTEIVEEGAISYRLEGISVSYKSMPDADGQVEVRRKVFRLKGAEEKVVLIGKIPARNPQGPRNMAAEIRNNTTEPEDHNDLRVTQRCSKSPGLLTEEWPTFDYPEEHSFSSFEYLS